GKSRRGCGSGRIVRTPWPSLYPCADAQHPSYGQIHPSLAYLGGYGPPGDGDASWLPFFWAMRVCGTRLPGDGPTAYHDRPATSGSVHPYRSRAGCAYRGNGMNAADTLPLLEVKQLAMHFPGPRKNFFHAGKPVRSVDGV